jgi:hypothetical protein
MWRFRNKSLDHAFSVDELSGRQFVLVNEALNLGIAMYNAGKGEGIRYEMLFRDETIGALDYHNGLEYVHMLRRAMEIDGFLSSRLYFSCAGCLGTCGPGYTRQGRQGQSGRRPR